VNICLSCEMERVAGIVAQKQSAPTGLFRESVREQTTAAAAQGAFNAAMGVASVNMRLPGLPLVALMTPGTVGSCPIGAPTIYIAGSGAACLPGFEDPQE
jgi:hypothetical protein